MKDFGRAITEKLVDKLGGSLTYTAPGSSAISSKGIFHPAAELVGENGVDVVAGDPAITLQNKDIPRPVRNAEIVYTDPDDGSVETFLVDYIISYDTHVWRVSVVKR